MPAAAYGILRAMPFRPRSLLADFLIIVALGAIAIVGYKFSPLLLPKADLTLMPTAGCDLNRSSCSAAIPGGGSIEMSLSPHPVPVIQPINIVVTLHGITAGKAEIDFQGVAMEMGYNRVSLRQEAPDRLVGTATIPVCITGRMLWRATLLLENETRKIAVPFLFDAPTR